MAPIESLGEPAREVDGVGSADDEKVFVHPRVEGGAELAQHLALADELLAVHGAAALRAYLVFEVNGGHPGALELAHGGGLR